MFAGMVLSAGEKAQDMQKPENPKDDANGGQSPGKNGTVAGPVHAIGAVTKSMQAGDGSETSIQARLAVIERLRQKIQETEADLGGQTQSNRDKAKVFKNQNLVRERVMALLALKNLTEDGGIGQQVAEVARGFDNSVNRTQKAEEKINERGWVERLLLGGDDNAADEIQTEVQDNRGRIAQLKELRKGTGEEIGQFIDEQLQQLEVEQNRLQGLARREKESKGIFGWLFK